MPFTGLSLLTYTASASIVLLSAWQAYGFQMIVYLAGNAKFAVYLGIPHVPGAGDLAIFCGAMVGAGLF